MRLEALLILVLIIFVMGLFLGPVFAAFEGHKVEMVFNYSAEGVLNVSSSSEYASSFNDTVVSLVSAGEETLNTTAYRSGQAYYLSMKQMLKDNKFLLVVTQGSNETIIKSLMEVNETKQVGATFASFKEAAPAKLNTYLRLEYSDINLTNRIAFGKGNIILFIKNNGTFTDNRIVFSILNG